MYRCALRLRTSRNSSSHAAIRAFTSVKSAKSAELVSTPSAYYDFSNDSDAILSSFIEHLKQDESSSQPPAGARLARPTFEQIKERRFRSDAEMKVSLFSKDIVTTYNLFTTCLRSKEMDRAQSLLSSMYFLIKMQRNKTPMIDALNSYFRTWTQNEDVTVDQITSWFNESMHNYEEIDFDDRTYAILIDAIMSRSDKGYHRALVKMYQDNCRKRSLRDLLAHADTFKIENLRRLITDLEVPAEDIPKDLQEYFETEDETNLKREQEAARLARQFSFENDQLPTLEKDSEELQSVDTFGMKVIRHSIMALATKNKSQILADFASKLDATTPIDISDLDKTAADIDFFSIYKSLSREDQVLFDKVLEEFNYERQLHVETKGLDSARERWRHDYEQLTQNGIVTTPKHLNHFLYIWQQELTKLIQDEVNVCKELLKNTSNLADADKKANKARLDYAPFIVLVSPEKMAVITIMELLKTNGGPHSHLTGARTARAVVAVGGAIEIEYNSQERLDSTKNSIARQRLRKALKTSNNRKAKLLLRRRARNEQNLDDPALGWTYDVQAKLGSILISFLLQVAKVTVRAKDPTTKEVVEGHVPAFYHSFQYVSGTKVGVIRLQPEFAAKLAREEVGAIIQPQGLPMLVKPKPWTSFKEGGYLTTRSLLARSKNSAEQTAYLRAASDSNQLKEVYEGLNILGNTPWTVNKKIFKIVAKVWNTGKPFLDIPGVVETPVYPVKPPRNSAPEVLRNWKQEVQRTSNEFGKNRSLRCDTNYKLEIARAFLGEKFYFPHNLDFRGRAYPLSPHFNHLGNDLTRSLLIFWNGRELGPNGLNWLKVHISNMFGIDKVSLQERIQFANDNIENFKRCCTDPLSKEGSMWQRADKPWQALSVMYEIVEALKLEDPSKFVSHQPVHQDGTCNGLQHYAALGGDIAGATQVNLIPQDKPADVYSFVAGLVQKRVDADVAKGVEEAIKVQHHIKRKVVKQTVMTNVYGVTFVGARDQIAKQLDEIFTDRLELVQVSRYLTKQVFASIRELFGGAHLIQKWLGDAAKIISKSFCLYADDSRTAPIKKAELISSVVWTTPLGLPIVQPYRAVSKRQVKTNLQTVYISDPYMLSPVDGRKQMSALPPNFVHSLDATHMLKSSISCGEKNISFAAVHDSYWTHASDVATMNTIIRDEFVNLYQMDIIKGLKEEFEKRYADYIQIIQVTKTSEIGKKVIELQKHLSKLKDRQATVYDELYIEVERRKLLRSKNPEDVEAGKELVTTISAMENFDFLAESAGAATGPNLMTVLAPFKLPDIPEKGDLDINCVKDSAYFFS